MKPEETTKTGVYVLEEMTPDELASFQMLAEYIDQPTEREVRVDAPDRFHKGTVHWQRTAH